MRAEAQSLHFSKDVSACSETRQKQWTLNETVCTDRAMTFARREICSGRLLRTTANPNLNSSFQKLLRELQAPQRSIVRLTFSWSDVLLSLSSTSFCTSSTGPGSLSNCS